MACYTLINLLFALNLFHLYHVLVDSPIKFHLAPYNLFKKVLKTQ